MAEYMDIQLENENVLKNFGKFRYYQCKYCSFKFRSNTDNNDDIEHLREHLREEHPKRYKKAMKIT